MKALFKRLSRQVACWAGSPWGFLAAVVTVLVWAGWGPFVGYSETWQLIINTGTTIVTFLMTFLIQATQNIDSSAIHLKLDALIVANEKISNRLAGVEKED